MSDRLGNNNKLILIKTSDSFTYIMTYVIDKITRSEPIEYDSLSRLLRQIISKDGIHYTQYYTITGGESSKNVFNDILDNLGEEYDLDNIVEQLKNNIYEIDVDKTTKITKKDKDGKALKDGNKYIYEMDKEGKIKTETKTVKEKTFKKLLYHRFNVYDKNGTTIECVKIYGHGLTPTKLSNKINKELNKHYTFKNDSQFSFINSRKSKDDKSNDETNEETKTKSKKNIENKGTKEVNIRKVNNENIDKNNDENKKNKKNENKNEEKNKNKNKDKKNKNKEKDEEKNEIKDKKNKNKEKLNKEKELSNSSDYSEDEDEDYDENDLDF